MTQAYSVKFEASKKQGVIRVEADLSTSEVVVRMLVHIVERIKSVIISVDASEDKVDEVSAKRLNDTYVKEVERLTSTVIVKPPSRGHSASQAVGSHLVLLQGLHILLKLFSIPSTTLGQKSST